MSKSTPSESDLLTALAQAKTTVEQTALISQLEEVRAAARAKAEQARLSSLVAPTLSHLSTDGVESTLHRSSAASDWLGDIEVPTVDRSEMEHTMRAQATVWLERRPAMVRADGAEFRTQAKSKANYLSNRYPGLRAEAAQAFLDQVQHLAAEDWARPGDDDVTVPKAESHDPVEFDGDASTDEDTEISASDTPSLSEGTEPESDKPMTGDGHVPMDESGLNAATDRYDGDSTVASRKTATDGVPASTCSVCGKGIEQEKDGSWSHNVGNDEIDHEAKPVDGAWPESSRRAASRKTAAEMVRDAEYAVLKAEFAAALAALRASGLRHDADHPIARRYRDASDAVNHANRSRDWAIANGESTASRKTAGIVVRGVSWYVGITEFDATCLVCRRVIARGQEAYVNPANPNFALHSFCGNDVELGKVVEDGAGGWRMASRKTAAGVIRWEAESHFGVDFLTGKAPNGDIYGVYHNPNANPYPCSWANYGPRGDTGPNPAIALGRGFRTMGEAVEAAEAHAASKGTTASVPSTRKTAAPWVWVDDDDQDYDTDHYGEYGACIKCGTDVEFVGVDPSDFERQYGAHGPHNGWWDRGGNYECPEGGYHESTGAGGDDYFFESMKGQGDAWERTGSRKTATHDHEAKPGKESSRREASMPDIDDIMRYEQGEMDEGEVISLFQGLVDSGMAWRLQGSYGRMAQSLIDAGLVTTGSRRQSSFASRKTAADATVALVYERGSDDVYDRTYNWESAQSYVLEGYVAIAVDGDGHRSRDEIQAMLDADMAAYEDLWGAPKWRPSDLFGSTVSSRRRRRTSRMAGGPTPFGRSPRRHHAVDQADKPCASCGRPVGWLEVFPNFGGEGILCIDCYSETPEGRRMPTSDELTRMWGGPVRQGSRRTAAEGQTCSVCGDKIAKDPEGGGYHHDNGEKHDHEAKPGKESSRKIAVYNGDRVVLKDQSGTAGTGYRPGTVFVVQETWYRPSDNEPMVTVYQEDSVGDTDVFLNSQVKPVDGTTASQRTAAITADNLNREVDFDSPFSVDSQGNVETHVSGYYAPEVYHVGGQPPNDVEIGSSDWEAWSTGRSNQHGYRGAVLHASEQLSGGMARDLLSEPGVYVITTVEDLDDMDNPAGWIVLKHRNATVSAASQKLVCGSCGHTWNSRAQYRIKCPKCGAEESVRRASRKTAWGQSRTDGPYNGWTNWDTWNAALWINNEEAIYRAALGTASPQALRELVADWGLTGDGFDPDKVNWDEVWTDSEFGPNA